MADGVTTRVTILFSLNVESQTICPLRHFIRITATCMGRETSALERKYRFQRALGLPRLSVSVLVQ
jgi:hypothetical protein